jgi:hypothetical protein
MGVETVPSWIPSRFGQVGPFRLVGATCGRDGFMGNGSHRFRMQAVG